MSATRSITASLLFLWSVPPVGATRIDPARGADLYESRCIACHSLDANRVGPKHRGVYGRRAGSVADYRYSEALERSGVRWDESTLDRWLADPESLIPGQRMNFRIQAARDRADIIAYLKRASR